MSRYQFAASLNTCLEKIEGFVYDKFGRSTEDLNIISREDNPESKLVTVAGREEETERKIAIIESSQF